jgi:hypothetical protein
VEVDGRAVVVTLRVVATGAAILAEPPGDWEHLP